MKIKFNKHDLLDYGILSILMLQVMFLNWFNLTKYTQFIIIFMISLSIINRFSRYKKDSVICILVLLSYGVINHGINGGSEYIFAHNMFKILPQIMILIYIAYLIRDKQEFVEQFIKNKFWNINIYMFINIPILLLQLRGEYWLAGYSDVENNFVPDLISGLFGYNGTPFLGIFSAFFFVYNINYYMCFLKRKYRMIFLGYNFFMLVFFLYISTKNDNKGFYIVTICFLVMYYIVTILENEKINSLKKKLQNLSLKIVIFAIVLSVAVTFLYKYTAVRDIVDLTIVKFKEGLNYSSVIGGGERFGIILYALNSSKKIFGHGLGKYYWTQEYSFGYKHYGISDMGTFLCLGGIFFVLLIFIFLYKIFKYAFGDTLITWLLLVMFAILLIYTQIITIASATIPITLFCLTCLVGKNRYKKEKY